MFSVASSSCFVAQSQANTQLTLRADVSVTATVLGGSDLFLLIPPEEESAHPWSWPFIHFQSLLLLSWCEDSTVLCLPSAAQ